MSAMTGRNLFIKARDGSAGCHFSSLTPDTSTLKIYKITTAQSGRSHVKNYVRNPVQCRRLSP